MLLSDHMLRRGLGALTRSQTRSQTRSLMLSLTLSLSACLTPITPTRPSPTPAAPPLETHNLSAVRPDVAIASLQALGFLEVQRDPSISEVGAFTGFMICPDAPGELTPFCIPGRLKPLLPVRLRFQPPFYRLTVLPPKGPPLTVLPLPPELLEAYRVANPALAGCVPCRTPP